MCLILFAISPPTDAARDYHFIMAANRDEFYARPTRPMTAWSKPPHILAGKDLEAGGTWFGVAPSGRFAAITNYRDLSQVKSNAPSRGELIPALLEFDESIPRYLERLDQKADAYSGFNILAGDAGGPIFWYTNQTRKTVAVDPGVHGLSNHLLDTPWPKIIQGKAALESAIKTNPRDDEAFFHLLSDTRKPADDALPDTGVGLEWERLLSPLFIESDTYGTRSSTLMKISRKGKIRIVERTWTDGDDPKDRTFTIETQAKKNS